MRKKTGLLVTFIYASMIQVLYKTGSTEELNLTVKRSQKKQLGHGVSLFSIPSETRLGFATLEAIVMGVCFQSVRLLFLRDSNDLLSLSFLEHDFR